MRHQVARMMEEKFAYLVAYWWQHLGAARSPRTEKGWNVEFAYLVALEHGRDEEFACWDAW